jgi:hypothetical protein
VFLTDTEIDAMCAGVKRNADKRRKLRDMGLIVNEKPNGRPLVVRSHAEAVLSGRAAAVVEVVGPDKAFTPDREAFILKFRKRAT